MSGSQCQNAVLMKLMAVACDMPVLIPQYVHAAVVHGAAMLGAKAASADKNGKTEPLWDIMDRMSKPGRVVSPSDDPHEKELLGVKYKVFLEQCHSQREYRRNVDEVVERWGKVEGAGGKSQEKAQADATGGGVDAGKGEEKVEEKKEEKKGGGIAMLLPH